MDFLWPYLVLLFLIAFEGDITIIAAAGAAAADLLNLSAVFIVSLLGNTLSDILWIAIGYYSKVDWILRRMKWAGITAEKLDMLIQRINNDAIKMLLLAKLTNWMTIPALVATGAARVPWRRWILFILVSNFVVAVVYVLLGYYMTASFLQIQKGIGYVSLGMTLLVVLILTFYIRQRLKQKQLQVDQAIVSQEES